MGPRSSERGNDSGTATLHSPVSGLQWGRARLSAETLMSPCRSASNALLQWGRALSSAETRTGAADERRRKAFNGAALLMARARAESLKLDAGPSMGPRSVERGDITGAHEEFDMPSMGPRSVERGITHARDSHRRWPAPSMGPRSSSAETLSTGAPMARTEIDRLQWGRAHRARKLAQVGPTYDVDRSTAYSAFNGAALSRARKPATSSRILSRRYCELQWGRAQSSAETDRAGRSALVGYDSASMGPRSV